MQRVGLAGAILSTALGGSAIVSTRFLSGALDPVTIGAVRFGGGFLILALLTVLRRDPWPPRADWPATVALGLMFFGLFPVLFNLALVFTTAAHGALALSTTPVFTMLAGVLFGVERPTVRRGIGVAVAIAGVAVALGTGAAHAPEGDWRGDLLMLAAACCMALYNVWCQPFIRRSSPLSFAAAGMGLGGVSLLCAAALGGGLAGLAGLDAGGLFAVAYLATMCGALGLFLWAFALGHISPTIAAVSIAVNPITAALLALPILGEPLTANLAIGLAAVLSGIAIASSGRLA